MRSKIPYTEALGPSKCHPRIKSTGRKTQRCLPARLLRQLEGGRVGGLRRNRTQKQPAKEKQAEKCAADDEHCLVETTDLLNPEQKKKILASYFRPERPDAWEKDPDMWLDNFNIEAVMKQYEDTNPHFKFFGVFPVDFASKSPYAQGEAECLMPKMCKISLPELREKGYHSCGLVYNLDPHNKGGSHWISSVLLLGGKGNPLGERSGFYYFDSYGLPPPKQIKTFMENLTLQDKDMELGYNGRRFQFGNSECGMYSLFFIICMIHGVAFKKFVHHPVSDSIMLQLRHWLFA
jgi:hypothetical protein